MTGDSMKISAMTTVMMLIVSSAPILLSIQSGTVQGAAPSPVKWSKDAYNPLMSQGGAGTWDSECIACHCVINDGGTYRMWYGGSTKPYQEERIGYATSPDGRYWTKYESNPVLGFGSPGSWDSAQLFIPVVIKDGSAFKMWYGGYNGNIARIGYATSPDGIAWTRYAGNPVMDVGPAGSWESKMVAPGTVIKENGEYRLWYQGSDGKRFQLGYASSPDGRTWTRHAGNPVLMVGASGDDWDRSELGHFTVVNASGSHHGWYAANNGVNWAIGYANSPDGTNWTKYAGNPILTRSDAYWEVDGVLCPWVVHEGTSYRMWYAGAGRDGAYNYACAEGMNPNLNPPTLVSPPDGSWSNRTRPMLGWTFNDTDIADVSANYQLQVAGDQRFGQVLYDSGRVGSAASTHNVAAGLPEGTFFWRVQVWTANFECSGWSPPWRLGIDTTAPVIDGFSINGGDNATSTRELTLSIRARDPGSGSGAWRMRIRADGSDWTAWQEYADAADFQLDGGNGNRTIAIQVMDRAGNPSQFAVAAILLDTVEPESIFISINGGDDFTNSTSVALAIGAQDPEPGSGVQDMAFSDDGVNWGMWAPFARACQYNLPSGDGTKTVRLRVRDKAGNVCMSGSDSIFLDSTAPACAVSPLPANADDTSFMVGWNGTDAASWVSAYEIQYRKDGGDWTDWIRNTTNKSAAFTGEDEHNYSFRARATDPAGNTGDYPSTGTGPVRISIPAPVVAILRPSPGSTVKGACTVAGTAYHPKAGRAVELVRIQIDEGPWQDASGTGNWSRALDTMKLRNGMHTLNASAYDGSKYSKTASVEFWVKNSVSVSEELLSWALLVVIVAAAMGVAAYLSFGRKRPPQ